MEYATVAHGLHPCLFMDLVARQYSDGRDPCLTGYTLTDYSPTSYTLTGYTLTDYFPTSDTHTGYRHTNYILTGYTLTS